MPSKIIIVEDSKEILRGVTRALDEVGYIVVGASDGCEGLEVIRENQDCNLIISDLNMPRMSGIEMVEKLGEEKLCPEVPKVILTTEFITKDKNSNFLHKKGRELGIRAWIVKPRDFFDERNIETFLSIIKDVLDGR